MLHGTKPEVSNENEFIGIVLAGNVLTLLRIDKGLRTDNVANTVAGKQQCRGELFLSRAGNI